MKNLKIKITDVVDGKAESPLPLEVIPNYMGISLCSVDSIEWIEHEDSQIEKLTINFIPNMENRNIEQAKEMEKEQMCEFADEFAIECINFHHEKTMSTERFFELTYGGNK